MAGCKKLFYTRLLSRIHPLISLVFFGLLLRLITLVYCRG